jgi:hypothetical protein
MLRSSPTSRALCHGTLAVVTALSLGCFAYGRGKRDIDRTPIVNTGVGATILYPGESPPLPGSPSPGAATQPGVAPPSASGAPSGSASGSGSVSMIGGAQRDEQIHAEYREEPLWSKYLVLPLAVIASPFRRAFESRQAEPEPGPAVPQATTAPSRPVRRDPLPDYESARLQSLERELEQRRAQPGATPGTAPPSATPPERAPTPPSGGISIADELASLRGAPTAPTSPGAEAPAVEEPPVRPALPTPAVRGGEPIAHGLVDRDGDGRVDQWIYREQGEIVREAFDENGDGQPDRTLHYDLATHRIHRVEEDTDGDGAPDSWTDYRNGEVARRRGDADRDGVVDTWTYYAGGRITRHERDTTGDGFRDRVGHYRDGRLEREELDTNGDGVTDATLYYDANERVVRREEDANGDGTVDLVSHYESGRLIRREVLDPAALRSAEAGTR